MILIRNETKLNDVEIREKSNGSENISIFVNVYLKVIKPISYEMKILNWFNFYPRVLIEIFHNLEGFKRLQKEQQAQVKF